MEFKRTKKSKPHLLIKFLQRNLPLHCCYFQQTSKVAQQLEDQKSGINITQLQEIMKQEDVIDRKLEASKKKEQKE